MLCKLDCDLEKIEKGVCSLGHVVKTHFQLSDCDQVKELKKVLNHVVTLLAKE